MHDAFYLEEKNIPTAVIVTEVFLHEAHTQRTALGMNELVFSIPKMWKQERLKSKVKRWRKQSK